MDPILYGYSCETPELSLGRKDDEEEKCMLSPNDAAMHLSTSAYAGNHGITSVATQPLLFMLRSHLEPYTFNFGKSFVAFLVAFIPKTVNLLPIGTTFKVTDESWGKNPEISI